MIDQSRREITLDQKPRLWRVTWQDIHLQIYLSIYFLLEIVKLNKLGYEFSLSTTLLIELEI